MLATRLPGTLPFLAGEEHGVCYAELDAFVETLAEILSDAPRMERLGAAGARSAAAYDWKQIAGTLVSWMTSR